MSCRFVERKVGSTLIAVAVAALVLLASATAQAATNCDAPIGALVHGASTSVTDSTTTPTLTGGSATATCNNGTLVYTGASCVPGCGATTVNWGAGCTASAPAILSGASSNLTNTNPAYGGTVTSSCTNGVRASSSAVCNANCTIPAGQTWVVGANTCTNPTAFTIAHGANGSGTDATQPTTGTGTWSCTNGSATLQGTSTCYAQCAAQAVNWSQAASNCTGTSAVLAHGANGTVSDATGPAMGNVNISCNNGTLSQSSPVCDGTNSCAATTVNWTAGGRSCDAAVAAGVHGSSQALTDATANIAPGGTGTATATCSNGSWVTSSPVCNASCGTQTVNWTLTSNNCDASSGAILTHGGTRTITDAAAPTTGTRDIGCNNGTVTQSGGTCVTASLPPQEDIPPVEGNTSNPCTPSSYVVPAGVTKLFVQLWGAGAGAAGGYTQGYLDVTPGETLTLITGQQGDYTGAAACGGGGPSLGPRPGAGGGGRSAVRRGSTELMTAGGGGGNGRGYWGGQGGLGGGTSGTSGVNAGSCGRSGGGGTQTAGGAGGTGSSYMNGTAGSAFQGGSGGTHTCTGGCRGAGGGGGYFGGGGGAAGASSCSIGGGGGGGSSYCGGSDVSHCLTYAGYGSSPAGFSGPNGRVTVTPVAMTPTPTVFNYTGANQTYTVPAGANTLLVQLWGGGGMGAFRATTSNWGASGGYTQGYLSVTPGETLTIIAGAGGGYAIGSNVFGGGGSSAQASGGGGRSAIRRGATELMTAGGGGGGRAGSGSIGGMGGGAGTDGFDCDLGSTVAAKSGGNGGARGECGSNSSARHGTAGSAFLGGNGHSTYGGGGGGGYVGGGGGGGRSSIGSGDYSGSGGGGSGYCHSSGITHCTTITGYGAYGGSYIPRLDGLAVHTPSAGGKVIITAFP